ncbi:MAG TPA: BTAD domain-containing putative transcriptional regulator [Anaerolineae bacterium]|nr:BTAD domain-containing putative transcriptional regulator [Anaerolineae bacterium]
MDSNLLVTKVIVPSRRSDVLRRPRLLDFLHEYIDRKLLLVSASAGYGKTSLLVDFAHDTDLPVCWYSLDQGDQDPQVFLEYLVAAIQRRFPHFGGRTSALLHHRDQKRSPDALVGALVTDIHEQIDSFFVIVLDDYQLIEDSAPVNQLIDRLLYHLPENTHLILASRTIPAQLTLTRLTARQQVAGLGVGDLRFTPDEIRALMQHNYGLEITPAVANDLAAQSEGWIAGIVLTTPTLWRGLFQEWVKGYGPGSQLFEYLAAEVLAEQPIELQHFLLQTSVLAQMEPALCNELLGMSDSLALMQLAEKRNLFITRLEDKGYRYHPLFREFLQMRLRQTQPARFFDLQRQAAANFERHGQLDQAIEHWFTAGAPEDAARLIQIIGDEYYALGRWTTLTRWLDALPESVVHGAPVLLLLRAILMAESGGVEQAQPIFQAALTEFEQSGDVANVARTLIESARYENDPAIAVEKCERAIVLLPRQEFLLNALGYHIMGVAFSRKGDFVGAIPILERAAGLYEIANNRYLQSDAENDLGVAYLFTGDRVRAEIHLENALNHWRRLGHDAQLANAMNSIAVMRYQQGELTQANSMLQEALGHARRSGHLRVEAYVLSSIGDVYRDLGKLSDALEVYTDAEDLATKIHDNYLITFMRVAVGEVWRLVGDLQTAERVLQTALQAATAHRSDYEMALVQLALGALRLAQNEENGAVQHLEHALPQLEHAHTKRESGRAHFLLAGAAWRRKQPAQAVHHLRVVADIGKELDEYQFILNDAAEARDLLELAIKRRAGGGYYKRLLEKLEQRPAAARVSFPVLESAWPRLELFAFGEARVLMDGVPVQKNVWQTATTKELFFFFATNPQGWRKEQIIEQLWPHASHGQGNDLFHSSVYRIRRALFPECLVFRNGVYQLNPEAVVWSDAEEFESRLTAAAQATESHEQIEQLEHAIELYHGDYLDEFYSDWCAPRREQLRSRYLNTLAQLGRSWIQLGNLKRGQEVYQELLQQEPLDEATYRELIRLYLAAGNRPAAMQLYEQCVARLRAELGVPPMPETIALYERLLEAG